MLSGSGQFLSHNCWSFAQFFWNQPPKKLSNTNSENNNNSLLMCFQSSPWQKPMGDMFGVCLLYFSLVPSGNMYTYVHIDSYAHAHFNSVLSNSRKTTHVFFWKCQKTTNKLAFLVVGLIWAYGIIHKGLDPWKTGKNKCMYINIYVLCFCFQELDAIVFFLCFFLNCFRNCPQ